MLPQALFFVKMTTQDLTSQDQHAQAQHWLSHAQAHLMHAQHWPRTQSRSRQGPPLALFALGSEANAGDACAQPEHA